MAAHAGAKDAKPRTLSVIGARGGVGATTIAVTVAAMLGARLKEEVDLVSVRTDLAGVVTRTLEPAHLSVWLRERE